MQLDAPVQASPVSSKAQYVAPEIVSQRVPVMQSVLEEQRRVQREAPPWSMGLQTRGEAHCPFEVQGSSSCRFIGPPALLDADDAEEALDDEDAPDDEDDEAPELEELVPVPELELELGPPLLDEAAPPPLPPLPPLPGTHWAFWSQA